MTNAEERRAQPRAGLDTPAVAFLADQRVECRAVDISIGGIALLSPVLRQPGQFLRVNFSLSRPGGIPRWYDADGLVVRVGRKPSGVVLGVQFVVIEDRVARDVHGYVLEALQQAVAVRPPVARAMPDALHPPPVTGEFYPAGGASEPVAAPRRRTAEYGMGDAPTGTTGAAPPPAAAPARSRTNPPIPRSSVAAPVPATPMNPAAEAEHRRDLERLFREALNEVEGTPRKRSK